MNHDRQQSDIVDLPSAIAIIGMACRFPGARNLDEFRRNLENGVESITALSDQELLRAGVDRELLSNPNYVKAAPLLDDADQFDAGFFEYSPREAEIMDPQQRIFLECAWEALEDASHAGDASGSATGVFSGGGGIMSTYLLSDTHFNPQLTGTTASLQHVGNDKDYLSTRVSYKLNLRGPGLTVQTACSTSLVAVHLACQSLLAGECDMALAGGTTVRVPQRAGYLFKEGNVFSRDGHCRPFDAEASGTVFGSGIGVVVLKRLKDALRDCDPIRAVIRATVINNDGSENKTSYWAPHADGQAAAMRRALQVARVEARTIGYVEAHGTATKKGDPTEIRALTQAFGPIQEGSCAIGSVKSNIGHPESAAGVAGLIKAVLSLEHQTIFPTLHYSRPNPEIDFLHGFYVNAKAKPWHAGSSPRRAAVNSLGIGGTNAFAILEEAPDQRPEPNVSDRPWHVLTLSAKSPEALDALAARFGTYLSTHSAEAVGDVCHTANAGRAHFDHRLALVASSTEEAAQLAVSAPSAGYREAGQIDGGVRPRIGFLFTGQGSQYVNMARELYQTHTIFREVLDDCAGKLSSRLQQPLLGVLYPAAGDASLIDETAYTQPALFAIEYALAALWRSWNVEPSVLIGHSIGEIVAACVSGVFSLDDAVRLTAERGRLMQALPRGGGMAALRCTASQVAEAISPYHETISIAAVNSPNDVVISGRLDHVEAIVSALERDGVMATRLKVSHAFHSPLLKPMLAEFEQVARSVTYSRPTIPLISNVTGQLATDEIATPAYWVRHVRESVRFAEGVTAARAHGVEVFLETGPAPVLLGMARQCLGNEPQVLLPSLRLGRSDWRQICETLAALYVRGVDVDWAAFDRPFARRRVHLPTYPFQRKRYWLDAPATGSAPLGDASSPLLGRRLRLPQSSEIRFEAKWSPNSPAYLDDHRIFDTVVVPGASHVGMVLRALDSTSRVQGCVLEDIVFPQALTLPEGSTRTAQLILTRDKGNDSSFQVVSLRDGEDDMEPGSWVVHATGRVATGGSGSSPVSGATGRKRRPATARVSRWRRRCTKASSGPDFYAKFWDAGYHLRGAFRWISRTWAGDKEILCQFGWPDLPDEPATYPLYPSLIDACFQAVFSGSASDLLKEDAVYVPFSIRRFEFCRSPRPGAPLWCHAALSQPAPAANSVDADITLCDANGRVIATIEGCQLREVRRHALVHVAGDLADALYAVEWQRYAGAADAVEPGEPGLWLVFADSTSVADGLIRRLQTRNERCIRVDAGAGFRRMSPDHYELDGSSPEDLRRLLADVSTETPECRGILHLWSLDASAMDEGSSAPSWEGIGGCVLHLVQAVAKAGWAVAPRLWLVTRGAQPVETSSADVVAVQQAALWGLGHVIALEHPELACVRVDLDPAADADNAEQLFQDVWSPDVDDRLAYRHGTRHVARLVRRSSSSCAPDNNQVSPADAQPMQLRLSEYGQFDNLTLQPLKRRSPRPGEVEVQVRAAGLNFRDVLNVLALLERHYAEHLDITRAADITFGFECAGTVVAVGEGVSGIAVGDDVIAVGTHEAMASFVTMPREFVAAKPPALSFEEAATLPLAFVTAYYGLHCLAGLKAGDRVLIHAAAGGVGQACVQWSQAVGAEVFATASPGKWNHLMSGGVRHVFNSRTLDFATGIKDLTGGEGVDVVVNTLSGPFVEASFEVLKPGGRFIELGKRDVWTKEQACERRPDVAYYPFDLMEVARKDPKTLAALLAEVTERVTAGILAPLPCTVFPVSGVVNAFRYMAEAKHTGKIVLSMPPFAGGDKSPTRSIRQDASYLVTGGLGALGLKVVDWLVGQGARYIAIASRRQVTGEERAAVERIEKTGATVRVIETDVSDPAHVRRLLTAVNDMLPPLRGIIHAAGLLDDGVLVQQTWERFRRVLAPKVEGSWNLHSMTWDLPLDFFVCFSSVASLTGNAGQGNYAAANAFMDALVHYRRSRGLAGLSINWGPWDEVGMAAERTGRRQRRLAEQGFRLIAPDEGMQMFSRLLFGPGTQVGVVPINWTQFFRVNPARGAFLANVASAETKPAQQQADIRRQLEQAADPRPVLARYVRAVVGKVLGIGNIDEIDGRARLFDLGLESLMAVELRLRFEESLGWQLRPTALFDYPTIEALTAYLVEKLPQRALMASEPPAVVDQRSAVCDDLHDLTEDDIADRLEQELLSIAKVQES